MSDNYGYREFPTDSIEALLRKLDTPFNTFMAPVVYTSADEKILLLGANGRYRHKIPTSYSKTPKQKEDIGPFGLAQSLTTLLFSEPTGTMLPEEFHYLGLVKDNPNKNRVIVPLLVDLDYASDDPRLMPSVQWELEAQDHPLHEWIGLDDLPNLATTSDKQPTGTEPRITSKSAVIINFYLEHDTYIDK
ncbi:MAG: hypothetical protein Q7T41_00670 [Candidatus Saccharibacteria bacterium]|nr:hypothetical protein [Candidatus Saccharibacteria bacterium]